MVEKLAPLKCRAARLVTIGPRAPIAPPKQITKAITSHGAGIHEKASLRIREGGSRLAKRPASLEYKLCFLGHEVRDRRRVEADDGEDDGEEDASGRESASHGEGLVILPVG